MRSFFETALNRLAITGDIVRAIPEKSSVGESQSNGLAENQSSS